MQSTLLVPELQVQSGSQSGKRVPVRGELRIGRHPSNEISLDDPAASRKHASVVVTDEGIYVVDHGSANGTYVNDKRVTDQLLILSGDKIRVGETEFEFKDL